VVKVVALGVLLEEAETSSVWVLNWIDDMIGFGKINLFIVSNNLTLGLSFQRHLGNIPGLVVKQAMRVTQPGHGTEKDNWFLLGIRWHDLVLANFLILGLLTGGVGMVSVHIVSIICRRHFVLESIKNKINKSI